MDSWGGGFDFGVRRLLQGLWICIWIRAAGVPLEGAAHIPDRAMKNESSTVNRSEAEQKVADLVQRSGILTRTAILSSLNAKVDQVDCSLDEIIQQVQADSELVAKLMIVANSAWFGTRTKVKKVDEAYSRLGQTEFYHAVVTSVLRLALGETGPLCAGYWAHVDIVGRMNQLVAQHLAPGTEPTAFLLGLLHDVGIPIMSRWAVDYTYLAEDALGTGIDSTNNEAECYGYNHALVSMELARLWGFSPALASAIPFHHQYTLANAPEESRKLLANLMLTERIAGLCQGQVKAIFASDNERRLLREISVTFGVDENGINGVIAEIERLFLLRESAA